MNSKRITSLLVILALTLMSLTTAFAAPFDIKILDENAEMPFEVWSFDSYVLFDMETNSENYTIEYGEKNYSVKDVLEVLDENPELTFDEIVDRIQPIEEPDEDLEVVQVSAINDIEVEFGADTVELPEVVVVVLSDESEVEVPVTWEGEYDVNLAGTYELVGILDLSALENVVETDKVATVNVVVAEEVVATDLTAYEAALAAVVEEDYTEESWLAYQEVVTANVVTEENTQEEVDAATDAIIAAQAELVTLEEAALAEAIAAVNEADNYLTMQAALEAEALGLELGAYADFTDGQKEGIAAAVLDARPEAGFADVAAVQEAFDAEVSAIVIDAFDTAFAAINAVTVNTNGEMKTAIDANFADLDLQGLGAEYDELAAAQQTSVANAVFVIKAALPAPGVGNDRHEDAVAGEFYDKAELEAAFNDDTAMPDAALAELNAATDADEVLVAFEFKSLGLVFPAEYEAMSDEDKAAVAGKVQTAIGAGFANIDAAQVALEDAVLQVIDENADTAAAEAALLAVNKATNAVEMRLALESTDFATATPKANIDAKDYTSEQKAWLAEEVIALRNALKDYADDNTRNAEAVAGVIYDETELDSIVTTAIGTIDARISAITTAENSIANIVTPVEYYQLNSNRDGIDVDDQGTALGTEITTARTDVDAAVTAGAVEANLEGIEVLLEAEAKVVELQAEIDIIAAVNAVNAADGNVTAIRVALAAEELGLDAYNALSLTDKNAVAAAIDLALDDLEAYADDNTRNENAVANAFYDLAELRAAVAEAIANL